MATNSNLPDKINRTEFLEIYPPLNFSMSLSKNDIKNSYDAIKGNFTSLAKIRKDHGAETLFDFVTIWLVKLNEYVFGRSEKQMTDYQISETTMLIIDTYYYLNIAEVAIIFKKIKSGSYGKIFGELNGVFIMESFSQYFKERQTAQIKIEAEKRKIQRAENFDNTDDYVPMPESIKSKILSMENRILLFKS